MQQTSQQQRQNQNPNKADWEEWRESPVTQYFFNYLQREANGNRQLMGVGACKKDSWLETGQQYMLFATRAETYELINSVEYEDTLDENFTDRAQDISST